MARTMVAPTVTLALLLLIPIGLPAAAASEPMPPAGTIWTVFTTVEANVVDDHAVVKVIADIGNRGPDPEFPFLVQVPSGAYVTGLTIERDGEIHTARIEERDAARQEYEAHKSREETGGLVEKQRGSDAYAYLINVAEFTSVRATLTYEQLLSPRDGDYVLDLQAPVSGFGQDLGAAFDVSIASSEGVTSAWTAPPSEQYPAEAGVLRHYYRVGARPTDDATPFTVTYRLPPTPEAGRLQTAIVDGEGMFLHRLRLPATAASDLPVDLVMVLDTSGSMSGLKLDQMQDAARQLVGRLDADDRLALVPFSSNPLPAWSGLRAATNETRSEAMERIDNLFAGGGTNTRDAVGAGFAALSDATGDTVANDQPIPGRVQIVLFLTDGMGNGGREEAVQLNTMEARVFGVSFGAGADTAFVAGLARDGGGAFIHIPEGVGAEVDLADFMTRLTAPVATDIQVTYTTPGVTWFAVTPGTLFAGDAYVVVGTFPWANGRLAGTLSWTTDTAHNASFDVAISPASWAPQWTRAVIAYQLKDLEARIAAGEPSLEADLTALALKHGYVTDTTSLVLTLAPRAVGSDDCCWEPEAMGEAADSPMTATTRPGGSASQDPAADASDSAPGPGRAGGQGAGNAGGVGGDADHGLTLEGPRDDAEAEATPSPLWALLAALCAAAVVARRRVR